MLAHVHGLAQSCSISPVNALEILQSCTKGFCSLAPSHRYHSKISVTDKTHSIPVQFPERHDDKEGGSGPRSRLHGSAATIGRYAALSPRPGSGYYQIYGLVQNCCISIAPAMEILQSCAKHSKRCIFYQYRAEPALTHLGRATHICVGKLTTIGSDNGLSPGRRQAII